MELTLDQALQKGIEAHKAGQIEEAKRLYTSIINVQPRHPDANHNLGVLAISIGKTKQALPFFKTALESKPSDAQFWLSCIDVLIKLREWNDAKALLDQARGIGIKGEDLDRLETVMNHTNENGSRWEFVQLLQQAIAQRESGDFGAAIKLLTNYPNDFSNNVDLLSCLSHCYLLNEDIQNADIYLNKAKEIDSTNASVMWNDVRLLLATKNTPDALVVARKAIDLYPNDVEGIGVLGACLMRSKKIEEALLYLDKAVSLNPNYAEAFVNRGLIKLSTNDKQAALCDLEIGLELKLHIRPIWNVVVGLNVEFERFTQAIYFLLKMVEAEPEDEKLFETLMVCINELGDEAMLDGYKNVLKIKPDSAEVHNNLGTTLFKIGKVSAAMASFKKAIKIKPFYAESYCNLATALADTNNLDEAEDNYKQALKIQPDFSDAIFNLGKLLYKRERYEEAAGHLKLVDSDRSQCDLLKCLYELDQQSNFYDQLDYLMERGVNNAVIGSLVSRSKNRYGVHKPNPFCNAPLQFVLEI